MPRLLELLEPAYGNCEVVTLLAIPAEGRVGPCDGDKVEHIWVGDVTWDGKAFYGKVDNKPIEVSNVRLGQRVTVTPEDITDWMFVKEGKLMGGYTTRVLYGRLSPEEKAQFQKQAEFSIE